MIEWWEPHAEALQTAGVSDGIRNGCPRIWATINTLEPLASRNAPEGFATKSYIDGCDIVELKSPMTKDDHIVFVAAVTDDSVRIKRLYPQQDPVASFFRQGHSRFYAYCSSGVLYEI